MLASFQVKKPIRPRKRPERPVQRFAYSSLPLNPGSQEIRIAVLRTPRNTLAYPVGPELDLITIDLDDSRHLPYEALSYTWGRPNLSLPDTWDNEDSGVPIIINACRFDIRPNLYTALKALGANLTGTGKPHMALWIDAICIDQSNLAEKNEQVQRMHEIYSQSSKTIVWLGPADGTTQAAFERIHTLSRSFQQAQKDEFDRANENSFMHVLGKNVMEHKTNGDTEIGDDDLKQMWDPVRHMMARSYWNRAWIWQEVCRAQEVAFICGQYETSLNAFLQASAALGDDANVNEGAGYVLDRLFFPDLINTLLPLHRISDLRRHWQTPVSSQETLPSLVDALYCIRRTDATDSRDKVYAAFGLCHPSEALQVDYRAAVADVFVAVVERHIASHKDYGFLGHCQYRALPSISQLPSWAPDWTDRTLHPYRLGATSLTGRWLPKFYAAGGEEISFDFSSRKDLRILRVRGCILESVEFLADRSLAANQAVLRHDEVDFSAARPEIMINFELPVRHSTWLRQWVDFNLNRDTRRRSSNPCGIVCRKRGKLKRRIVFPLRRIQCEDIRKKRLLQFDDLVYARTHESMSHAYLRTLAADAVSCTEGTGKRRIRDWDELPRFWSLDNVMFGRTFATSTAGTFALVPTETRLEDEFAIFKGGHVAYVLRRVEHGYLFIGECYLHGYMDGEILREIERRGGWQDINLV